MNSWFCLFSIGLFVLFVSDSLLKSDAIATPGALKSGQRQIDDTEILSPPTATKSTVGNYSLGCQYLIIAYSNRQINALAFFITHFFL